MRQFYSFLFSLLLGPSVATLQAQTITSFTPASGNVGTLVTLSGSNLNLVSTVAVNGTACLLLDKTSTSLRLLVMPGTTSGPITTTGGTATTSAALFALTRSNTTWTQQGPKLVGTGGVGDRIFQGGKMALSADGNTLAVGGDNDNDNLGATWVFTRSGSTWVQQGPKLVGTGVADPRLVHQGAAVALSADGNTLAVGGYSDNNELGATWVFTRNGTSWTQQGDKLVGTGAAANSYAQQGYALALSADGNTLAVGGQQDDNNIGATWVFTRSGTIWTQQGPKLVGTGRVGTSSLQGGAVALSADGNTLAVGGSDDNKEVGATWLFTRSGTSWSQQGSKLVGAGIAGDAAAQGAAVALSADGATLVVGGVADGRGTGATWVFTRSGTSWSQQGDKLVGTGGVGRYVLQGHSVALAADGNTLAVGAYGDNTYTGATWVFARSGTSWSQSGSKLVGTGGVGTSIYHGYGVALSADGTTLASGGPTDNATVGATWVFSTPSSPLANRSAAKSSTSPRFFPNPVADRLTISGTAASAGTLRLFDSLGRSLFTSTYQDGKPLELSRLPAGLYWLQIDQAPAQALLKY
jgi:hypothetical protein